MKLSEKLDAPKKSTHRTEVVRVYPEPIPEAENLALVKVCGHQVVVRKDAYPPGSLAAFVVPDSLVPTDNPAFSFLSKSGKYARVKVRRFLKKFWSEGLLIPAPKGSQEGDDVSDLLGVTRYEPPEPGPSGTKGIYLGGEVAPSPPGHYPKYDVESWNRYRHIFTDGEPVVILEKLHGCNGRYLFVDGQMYCGSRTEWKREYPTYSHVIVDGLISRGCDPEKAKEVVERLHSQKPKKNLWWQALEQNPQIEEFCRRNPGLCVYGEVFGQVQDLKYGASSGQYFFRAFDVWVAADLRFLDYFSASAQLISCGVPIVPLLYSGPYYEATVQEHSVGTTTLNGSTHVREGCVVRSPYERHHPDCDRYVLKCINNDYLERA